MIAHIDTTVMDKCWNPYDSYGEICVGCGCCHKDKAIRYTARVKVLERRIYENEHFDMWYQDDPEMAALQKKNIQSNLRNYRRLLRYYKKKVKECSQDNSKT